MKIVQALVKQIGGKLRISIGPEGRGARFTVAFRSPAPHRRPGRSVMSVVGGAEGSPQRKAGSL